MGFIKVYTREVNGKKYPEELAYSIHFAFSHDEKEYVPLNRNYGILYAKATVRNDNSLIVKELQDPAIFYFNGKFGITARQLDKGAIPDPTAEGKLLYWTSNDLINFDYHGLMEINKIDGCPEIWSDTLKVDEDISRRMFSAWSPFPCGETRKESCYNFPLALGHADPVIFSWQGKWYYIFTNDNNGNIGFRVRRAKRVPELFVPDVEEYIILDYDEKRGLIQTFWAPEFHLIGGRLYLLFAVSGSKWGPQCHMMRLKKNGEIILSDDWEDPIRVEKKDGQVLAADSITLDMTYVKAADRSYLAWSQRWNIGNPEDSGSMIYIAEIDPDRPWRLISDPVLLSRPEYGWENQSSTINNEGPYPLYHDDMIYLSYSAGDARGFSYSIGFLSIKRDSNLIDPKAWKKAPSPVLSSYSLHDQYGPGHNSFFMDDEERPWIAYHAELYPDKALACTAIRRVYYDDEGRPRLDFH
jgi:GH43 family beta-xylosidase